MNKVLADVGSGLGFNTVKGTCITALQPMTEVEKQKIDAVLTCQARKYHQQLNRTPFLSPSLFQLMVFRMGRTSIGLELAQSDCDYRCYQEKGWFESHYYYLVHLGFGKKLVGRLFDNMARMSSKHRQQ